MAIVDRATCTNFYDPELVGLRLSEHRCMTTSTSTKDDHE